MEGCFELVRLQPASVAKVLWPGLGGFCSCWFPVPVCLHALPLSVSHRILTIS